MRQLPSLLLASAILLIPLAIHAEQAITDVWKNRLIHPQYPTNRTAPHPVTDAQPLPTHITTDLTLTPDAGPFRLSGPTEIAPDATLTIAPSTRVFADPGSRLDIHGTLIAAGTPAQPIHLTINHTNPDQHSWAGLVAHTGSHLELTHTNITHAATALTCRPASNVRVNHSQLHAISIGVYAETNCAITDSRIHSDHTGIVTTAPTPVLTNTTIHAPRHHIQHIKNVVPPTGGTP